MSVATLCAGLGAAAPPAGAFEACGSMLMPAAQLKQVSRGFSRSHSGVDLTAPYGSPIRAPMAGRVIFAGSYFGYGNMVDIRHEGGVVTRYAHLSAFAPEIRPGHEVAIGDLLGKIGTSGHAHGAHLHFEVRVGGRATDPKPYLGLANCDVIPGHERTTEVARAPDIAAAPVDDGRPGGLLQ